VRLLRPLADHLARKRASCRAALGSRTTAHINSPGLSVDAPESWRERGHACRGQLVRSLGVEQLVVAVNKMDCVQYDPSRFLEIQETLGPFLKGYVPASPPPPVLSRSLSTKPT
jgi:hypothetical protein